MILKNKMYKTAAIALAVVSVFGSNLQYVSAYNQINAPQVLAQYVDGNYELNTRLLNVNDTSKDSMANTYLKSSTVDIKDGKMIMKMVFTSGSMIKDLKPTVNGNVVSANINLDESSNERSIEFEIPSIDADIKLDVKINPFGDMVVNATCLVETSFKVEPDKEDNNSNDENSSDSDNIGDDSSTEDTEGEVGNSNSGENSPDSDNIGDGSSTEDTDGEVGNSNSGGNSSDSNNTEDTITDKLKNGYYQVKNIVKCDNQTGYAMVRNLLTETTNIEIKDGKTYLTFEMSGYSMMGTIKIQVDGKSINHTQTDLGNDKVRIKLEVPSIDSKITMNMYVKPMSSTVEFGIGLNKSTLKFISSNEEPTLPTQPSDNTNSNTNSSNNSSNNEIVEEDKTNNGVNENTTVVGKLYTIKNQVIHNNATGQQMARKYLNSASKIEEINGKYYATFTFTGQDLMKDHKIYVNGSKVSHSVVSKSGDSISIRFAVPSLDAKIKVELFVIPMSRNIDFEVKLLEDTLSFVKEFDADSTLPQTGSLLSTEVMMGAGGMISIAGCLVGKKKRK